MSDTENKQETTEAVQEGAETPAPETVEGQEGSTPESAPEGAPEKPEDNSAELPEWARNELSRVRSEAASYRTKLREHQEKYKDAKTPEEYEAATRELAETVSSLERQILVNSVAQAHKLPADLAALLKGADEAELTAHAKTLSKYAPVEEVPPTDLRGGLDPNDSDESFDPVAAARKARARRY